MADDTSDQQTTDASDGGDNPTPKAIGDAHAQLMARFNQELGVTPTGDESPSKGSATGDDNPDKVGSGESDAAADPNDPFAGLDARQDAQDSAGDDSDDPKSKDSGNEENDDEGDSEEYPKGAQAWNEWKEKETARIRAEYEKQLADAPEVKALKEKLAGVEKERDEATDTLTKVRLTESPVFRKKFDEPKADAVARVKAMVGEDKEGLALVVAMEGGTLTPDAVPSLEGLNQFQRADVFATPSAHGSLPTALKGEALAKLAAGACSA